MSIKLKPLNEQVIVITGASSGIGLATATEALKQGAAVVMASRGIAQLEQLRDEFKAQGSRIAICEADMAVPEDVEKIAETAIREFGGFDTWVNNAAAAVYGTMEEMDWNDHKRVFDVNYFGLLKGSLVALKHLREKGGAIINVGSIVSDRTVIIQGAYSASKHAVLAATDALRMEINRAKAPISVTLIKPGSIHTPYPEHAKNYMDEPARIPAILYDPRLVADAILFAAVHPKRQLYIGGTGYLAAKMGQLLPHVMDAMMEKFAVKAQQAPLDLGDPALRDNLYESRAGKIEGNQDFYVRRNSFFLSAQKHPLAATLVVGSSAAILGLLAINSMRNKVFSQLPFSKE